MGAKKTALDANFRRIDKPDDRQRVPSGRGGSHDDGIEVFEAGELLFQFGDEGGDLLFIKEGEVEVFRPDPNGEEYHFCNMTVGEVLGVTTLLDQSKRAASVRALTKVKVQVVRHERFRKMIAEAPKWLASLVKDLSKRLEISNRIYIQKASRLRKVEKSKGSLITVVNHIAQSLVTVARLETTAIDNLKVSPLDSVIKKVCFIGQYSLEFVEAFVAILRESKLIACHNSNGLVFLTKNDLSQLVFFETAVQRFTSDQNGQGEYFSLNELTVLAKLVAAMTTAHPGKRELKLTLVELHALHPECDDDLIEKCFKRQLLKPIGDDSAEGDIHELGLLVASLTVMLHVKKSLSDLQI